MTRLPWVSSSSTTQPVETLDKATERSTGRSVIGPDPPSKSEEQEKTRKQKHYRGNANRCVHGQFFAVGSSFTASAKAASCSSSAAVTSTAAASGGAAGSLARSSASLVMAAE